jgi:hypothetical protein
MKIFALSDPRDYQFARACRRGTWEKSTDGEDVRVQPLIMEWLPGSDTVGSFTWPSYGDEVVVSESAGRELKSEFGGFEFGPIEMIQERRLKRPKRPSRAKPRVWLPYEGPPLHDLWVTEWVAADMSLTTSAIHRTNPETGKVVRALVGIESHSVDYDLDKQELVITPIPRQAGKGLFIRRGSLGSVGIFRCVEFVAPILCTEPVRDYIVAREYTNIAFNEMGEIVGD